MKIQNKSLYFIAILILTILLTRIIALYIYNPNPIIKGFELHHFYYGILMLSIVSIFILFNKKNTLVYSTAYAFSIALVIDDLEYIARKFQTIEQYSSTLPSTIILTSTIALIMTLYKFSKIRLKIKNEAHRRFT